MNYLFVIGGVALAALIFLALYESYKSKNHSEPTSVTDMVNNIADEQLVIDHLDSKDLTSWFKQKNPNGSRKNVLIYPNEKNVASIKLPASIKLGEEKTIIQALLDADDNVVLCRSVIFTSINANLEKLFEENDGIIIVE